jgi:hypothetical protein
MNYTGYSREYYQYLAHRLASLVHKAEVTGSDIAEVDTNLLTVAADLFYDVATRAPDHETWAAEREVCSGGVVAHGNVLGAKHQQGLQRRERHE